MRELENILQSFKPISLDEISRQQARPRTELKYILPCEKLTTLLSGLAQHYRVLSIRGNSVFTYQTRYFDTPAFDIYLAHHNGRLGRFKIRQRTYPGTQQTFLEVKFRSNTNRITKNRIEVFTEDLFKDVAARDFISAKTPYHLQNLQPSVFTGYSRITLAGQNGERVTIDLDLEFSNTVSRHKITTFAIVEIKQFARTKTPALVALENMRIKPQSFSKYCFGVTHLYPGVKQNNFKKKQLALTKLNHDHALNTVAGC